MSACCSTRSFNTPNLHWLCSFVSGHGVSSWEARRGELRRGVVNHGEPRRSRVKLSQVSMHFPAECSETCFCFQLTRCSRGTFKLLLLLLLLLPQLKLKCWGIFFASMFAAQHQHTHTHTQRWSDTHSGLENYWHSCCCCSSCENLHAHKTIFRCR